MIKAWYRKKVHKQARINYMLVKEHAGVLLQLYSVHNIIMRNVLEPDEFYDDVNRNVSEDIKQRKDFDRHSKLLKKAFKMECKKHDYKEALKDILDHADFEAKLSVSVKST